MQTLLFLPLVACGILTVTPVYAKDLTPTQVIQRCQQAYDAVHTYQVTVAVTSVVNSPLTGGLAKTYHTAADIAYVRPGKIRVTGKGIKDVPFAYLSNGTQTFSITTGRWIKVNSIDTALSEAAGKSMGAAATMPALLFHRQFGYPFWEAQEPSSPTSFDTFAGHACYLVKMSDSSNGEGLTIRTAYWIDKKTFLLHRCVTSSPALHLHQDERFSGECIDAPLPASTFQIPAGK